MWKILDKSDVWVELEYWFEKLRIFKVKAFSDEWGEQSVTCRVVFCYLCSHSISVALCKLFPSHDAWIKILEYKQEQGISNVIGEGHE